MESLNINTERPKSWNHTRQKYKKPQQGPEQATKPTARSSASAHICKQGPGSGHPRQRLVSNHLGGVGETSPWVSPSKEGNNSTESELNRVQSTTGEAKLCKTKLAGGRDPEVSSNGSFCIESTSNQDSDSSKKEEKLRRSQLEVWPQCSQGTLGAGGLQGGVTI